MKIAAGHESKHKAAIYVQSGRCSSSYTYINNIEFEVVHDTALAPFPLSKTAWVFRTTYTHNGECDVLY